MRITTRTRKEASRIEDDRPSCVSSGGSSVSVDSFSLAAVHIGRSPTAAGLGALAARPGRARMVGSQAVCVSSAAVSGAGSSIWAVTSDSWRGGDGGGGRDGS
eukprot:scaffold125126_cov60-Phaeocystis_antarctica.AAC.1